MFDISSITALAQLHSAAASAGSQTTGNGSGVPVPASPIDLMRSMNAGLPSPVLNTMTVNSPDGYFQPPLPHQPPRRRGRKAQDNSEVFMTDGLVASTSRAPSTSELMNSESSEARPTSLCLGDEAAGPIRRRRFSTAKIQPTRIKKVMQSDEDIGRMVASVPVAIGRAMEYFAADLLSTAEDIAKMGNSRTLSAAHMQRAVFSKPYFRFLQNVFTNFPGKPPGTPDELNNVSDVDAQRPPTIDEVDIKFSPAPNVSDGLQCSDYRPIEIHSESKSLLSPMVMKIPPQFPSDVQLTSALDTPTAELPAKAAKRGSASSDILVTEKKRGRPRKIKRDEKCLDDELCKEVTSNIAKEDKDRELMPPPALPLNIARTNGKPIA